MRRTVRLGARIVLGTVLSSLFGGVATVPTAAAINSGPGTFAADTFDHPEGSGWGEAQLGGRYVLSGGDPSDYNVWNGRGYLRIAAPGGSRSAVLPKVAAQDVELQAAFQTDRLADGWGLPLSLAARVGDSAEYRVQARVVSDGQVYLRAYSVAWGYENGLGAEVKATGVSVQPGRKVWVRAQVTGINPTTIRMKAWSDGSGEPTWQNEVTDNGGSLQEPGGVGVRAAVSATSTTTGVNVNVDSFWATAPGGSANVDTAYFVAPWGWDANDGSFDKPWRTLQHAVDVAPKGAGVFLMNGTFDGATISRSGLTIAAADGMWPVISGGTNTLFFDGVSSGTLRNVTVAGGGGYRRTGVLVGSSDGVTISQTRVYGYTNGFGIRTWNSTNTIISGSDIYGNAEGVELSGNATGNRVSGNTIHDNITEIDLNDPTKGGGVGVAFMHSWGPALATWNKLWHNRAPLKDGTYDGSNFEIYGASDVTITWNEMWDAEHAMETGTDGPDCNNLRFTNNTAYAASTQPGWAAGLLIACASNSLVASNKLDGFDTAAISVVYNKDYRYQGSLDGLRITNNILTSTGKQLYHLDNVPSSVSIDRDMLWSNGGYLAYVVGKGATGDLGVLQSWTGFERGGLLSDPLYLDRTGHNYTLPLGSIFFSLIG